jgi:CRP-like cAMP-binding protein
VRSPLLKIAKRYHNKPDADDWFGRQFPEYAMGGVHASLIDEEFVRSLAEEMYQTELPLFRGLAPAAAEKFIAASRVLKFKAADAVVKRGDMGHEMYLILSGAAEVRRDVDGRNCTLATLGKGQIFGEMAFVSNRARTASVVAITNLEVLVLSQQFIQSLTRTMPATVIQVLLNLSVILCDRLNSCTEQLLASRAARSADGTAG